MTFHSKTHWKHPGVVIAFEPTWNFISNSSLENAELGNCHYSQIHVGEPSVRGETVYLAFLEPQLRNELSNVSEMSGVVQTSSTEKTAKHMFINLKVFIVVLVALYIQDVHPGDARSVSDFTLPLHHISLFIENLSYTQAKLLNLLPDDIKKYRLISNYVVSMFYFEQAAHK